MEKVHWYKILLVAAVLVLTGSCSSKVTQEGHGSIGSGKCSLRLVWDANTESDLRDYSVYVGTVSGLHDLVAGVTTGTGFEVTGADCGTTYFFAVTASDTSGNESEFSEEASGDAT